MTPAARAQIETSIAQMEAHIAVLRALLDEDCDCPEASAATVNELWERYLETLPREQWVASVRSGMKRLMARIGEKRAAQLKPADVEDYRDSPETREHYSPGSIRLQIVRLKSMLTWAVDTGRLARHPMPRVKPPKAPPKRETEISAEDEAAALECMREPMAAIFLVAIDAMMRRDEIRLMEWTDIDWDARKIRIPASRTKTKRERTGRITTRAAEALRKIEPVDGCPWVFTNPATKQPYSRTGIWKWWRAARHNAELKPAPGDGSVHLHDARGTGISRLVRLGASMPAIQVIVGHASLTTTARYVRVQGKDVDDAHALLEAHLALAGERKGPQRARVTSNATSDDRHRVTG